jgi:hypothetical protein
MGVAPISRALMNAFSIANVMQRAGLEEKQLADAEQRAADAKQERLQARRIDLAQMGATEITPEQENELALGQRVLRTVDQKSGRYGVKVEKSDLKGRVVDLDGARYVLPGAADIRKRMLEDARVKGEAEGLVAEGRERGRQRAIPQAAEEPGVVLPERISKALGLEKGQAVPKQAVTGMLSIARDMLQWEEEAKNPKGGRKVRSANFSTDDAGGRTAALVYDDGTIEERTLGGKGKSKGATGGQSEVGSRFKQQRADRLEAEIRKLQAQENELHSSRVAAGQKKEYDEKQREQVFSQIDAEIKGIQRQKADLSARVKKIFGERAESPSVNENNGAGTWADYKKRFAASR